MGDVIWKRHVLGQTLLCCLWAILISTTIPLLISSRARGTVSGSYDSVGPVWWKLSGPSSANAALYHWWCRHPVLPFCFKYSKVEQSRGYGHSYGQICIPSTCPLSMSRDWPSLLIQWELILEPSRCPLSVLAGNTNRVLIKHQSRVSYGTTFQDQLWHHFPRSLDQAW